MTSDKEFSEQESKEFAAIYRVQHKWEAAGLINQDPYFALVTLSSGRGIPLVLPLKCAVELEEKGYNIILTGECN